MISPNPNQYLYDACLRGDAKSVESAIKIGANDWKGGLARAHNREVFKMMVDKINEDWNEGFRLACEMKIDHMSLMQECTIPSREDGPSPSSNLTRAEFYDQVTEAAAKADRYLGDMQNNVRIMMWTNGIVQYDWRLFNDCFDEWKSFHPLN